MRLAIILKAVFSRTFALLRGKKKNDNLYTFKLKLPPSCISFVSSLFLLLIQGTSNCELDLMHIELNMLCTVVSCCKQWYTVRIRFSYCDSRVLRTSSLSSLREPPHSSPTPGTKRSTAAAWQKQNHKQFRKWKSDVLNKVKKTTHIVRQKHGLFCETEGDQRAHSHILQHHGITSFQSTGSIFLNKSLWCIAKTIYSQLQIY